MTPFMRTYMADQYADQAATMSLHTADPGTTGTAEYSGSGYSRQALTFGSASAGIVTASPVSFPIVADTHISHLGIWDGSGNFLDSKVVNVDFVTAGTYSPTFRYEQLENVT